VLIDCGHDSRPRRTRGRRHRKCQSSTSRPPADYHAHSRSAPTEMTPSTTFQRRSSRDAAAPEVRQVATNTVGNPFQLQAANRSDLSNGRAVSGLCGSVMGGSKYSDMTVVRTSSSLVTVDSHPASAGRMSSQGDGLGPPPTENFDNCASASPQLLHRWKTRPESGSQSSSAAAQTGDVDHHHYRVLAQPRTPNHGTKPHSVPCSPRLQARLTATQPWRPWSPPTSCGVLARPFQTADSGSGQSDSRASVDVPRLASSLLLAKIIGDQQQEDWSSGTRLRGNYTTSADVIGF